LSTHSADACEAGDIALALGGVTITGDDNA
jgi:hypothetical protein